MHMNTRIVFFLRIIVSMVVKSLHPYIVFPMICFYFCVGSLCKASKITLDNLPYHKRYEVVALH